MTHSYPIHSLTRLEYASKFLQPALFTIFCTPVASLCFNELGILACPYANKDDHLSTLATSTPPATFTTKPFETPFIVNRHSPATR
jgi:hypothetical protein